MSTALRTPAAGQTVRGKRATHVLSDGSALAVVNDGTSFYLYHSPDRTTWTLKATFTPGTAPQTGGTGSYSSALDASDNLHLVYEGTDGSIRFCLFTKAAGPTFTAGSLETVAAGGTNPLKVDIDVLTGTVAFVGAVTATSGKTFKSWVRRSSDNAWTALTDQQMTALTSSGYDSVSVARDAAGIDGSNQINVAYIVRRSNSSNPGLGDTVRIKKVTTTTGAQVSDGALAGQPANGFFDTQNATRDHMLFSPAANVWLLASATGNGPTNTRLWALRFSATAVLTNLTRSGIIPASHYTAENSVSMAYVTNVVGYFWNDTAYGWSTRCRYDATKNTFSFTGNNAWDDKYNAWVQKKVLSGNNRNFTFLKADTILEGGGATDGIRHHYNLTPPTQTALTPGAGATVVTDYAPMSLKINTGKVNPQYGIKAVFDFATDASFTTNLITYDPGDDEFSSVPSTKQVKVGYALDAATQLVQQGTWYVRARAVTDFGNASANTASNSFTNSHIPAATEISPAEAEYVDYAANAGNFTFSWDFSDTSDADAQAAYQLVITRTDTGAIVYDSGVVASAVESAVVALAVGLKDVPLFWNVSVGDPEYLSVGLGDTSDGNNFFVGDPPAVTITAPATDGDTVTNPNPQVTWTDTFGGTRAHAKHRVRFFQGTTLIHDSGFLTTGDGSYQPGSNLLTNGTSYSVRVTVVDTAGLSTTVTRTFLCAFSAPAAPTFTVDASGYSTNGYVAFSWTNAARDASFIAWRIYRRLSGTTTWKLVTEDSTDLTNYSYQEWFAPANQAVDYVVVQVAERFGVEVESSYAGYTTVTPVSSTYFLLYPDDLTQNIPLSATADDFTEEYEEETLNIIGRGRRKEYGTRWGYTGTLKASLRDDSWGTARQKRLQLETLKALNAMLYLRTPFGDVFKVAIGNLDVGRLAGVGAREFCDVSIPYEEVVDD